MPLITPGAHKVAKDVGGVTRQSSMPKQRQSEAAQLANGLLVRGCVIQVYPVDPNTTAEEGAIQLPPGGEQRVTYCDVLLYTALPGQRNRVLHKVLVGTNRGGIHDDRVWIPRAARRELRSGRSVTQESVRHSSPADLDGDHVLVGFMDNDLNMPVIMGGIPHPRNDVCEVVGNGDTEMQRHRGVIWGCDGRGNFTIDTSRANGGEYTSSLDEVGPPLDGSSGDIAIVAQAGATVVVTGPSNTLIMYPNGEIQIQSATSTVVNTIRMASDGNMEISNGNEHTTIRWLAGGNMEIDLGDDLNGGYQRDLTIRGTNVTVDSSTAQVGSGATDHAVLSETLQTELSNIATTLQTATSALDFVVPVPMDGGAAVLAALNTWASQVQTAINNLQSAVQAATSGSVTIRD